MSEIKTDVYTVQSNDQGGKLMPTDFAGRVRYIGAKVTPTSSGASGDVVKLCKVPAGARILPISNIHFEAGQVASMTVKVGDADDDDCYLASVAPGASATSKALGAMKLNGGKVYTEPTDINMTIGTAGLVASKTIAADIYFVVD